MSGISACFNSSGSQLLALRRRLPPVLYHTDRESCVCQFYHPQYYNSCTMKTCSFAGEHDDYVLSGSDDFNLYMWKVPKETGKLAVSWSQSREVVNSFHFCAESAHEWGRCHMVLGGHRSIVNQVRYNKNNNLIASSGVEKMVKVRNNHHQRNFLLNSNFLQLWSTLPIGGWKGSLLKEHSESQRNVYTHEDYIYLVGHTGQVLICPPILQILAIFLVCS